jgi:nucleotide-binding universal stress UspA family protein
MTRPVICGVDESVAARDAVTVAAWFAATLERELVLLHAAPPVDALPVPGLVPYAAETWNTDRHAAGERLLEERAGELGLQDLPELRVESRDPTSALLDAAERAAAEMIVLGTRGLGPLAAALFGSVSAQLIARAPCPVVIVPAGAGLGLNTMLCAVDHTAEAPAVLRAAAELAERTGMRLVLGHAMTHRLPSGPSAIPGVQDEAGTARSRAEAFLAELAWREGHGNDLVRRVWASETAVADALAELADEEQAGLIVIGARRRGLIRSALSGSVCLELPLIAGRPVVVVPPAVAMSAGAAPTRTTARRRLGDGN